MVDLRAQQDQTGYKLGYVLDSYAAAFLQLLLFAFPDVPNAETHRWLAMAHAVFTTAEIDKAFVESEASDCRYHAEYRAA